MQTRCEEHVSDLITVFQHDRQHSRIRTCLSPNGGIRKKQDKHNWEYLNNISAAPYTECSYLYKE